MPIEHPPAHPHFALAQTIEADFTQQGLSIGLPDFPQAVMKALNEPEKLTQAESEWFIKFLDGKPEDSFLLTRINAVLESADTDAYFKCARNRLLNGVADSPAYAKSMRAVCEAAPEEFESFGEHWVVPRHNNHKAGSRLLKKASDTSDFLEETTVSAEGEAPLKVYYISELYLGEGNHPDYAQANTHSFSPLIDDQGQIMRQFRRPVGKIDRVEIFGDKPYYHFEFADDHTKGFGGPDWEKVRCYASTNLRGPIVRLESKTPHADYRQAVILNEETNQEVSVIIGTDMEMITFEKGTYPVAFEHKVETAWNAIGVIDNKGRKCWMRAKSGKKAKIPMFGRKAA